MGKNWSLKGRMNPNDIGYGEAPQHVETMRLAIINAKEYILAHLDDAEDWRGQTLAALVGAMVGDRDRYKRDAAEAINENTRNALAAERLYGALNLAVMQLSASEVFAPRLLKILKAALSAWDERGGK